MNKDLYLEFVEQADMYAEDEYGLPAHEVMGRDIEHEDVVNWTAEELVEHYAAKYGLTRRSDLW